MKALFVLLLLIALAAGGMLLLNHQGGNDLADAFTAALPNGPGEKSDGQPASPLHAEPTGIAEPSSSERVALENRDSTENFDPDPKRSLKATIQLPAGHPSGEDLEIWAFYDAEDALAISTLVRNGLEPGSIEVSIGRNEWARRPFDGKGAELPVPLGAKTAVLVSVGRFLQPGAQHIRLDTKGSTPEQVLKPALGAAVEIEIQLPDDATFGERRKSCFELSLKHNSEAPVLQAAMSTGWGISDPVHPRDDLSLTLRGVPAEQSWELALDAEGFLDPADELLALEAGQVTRVSFVPERGGSLELTVVNESGEPLPEASINLFNEKPFLNGRNVSYDRRYGATGEDGILNLEVLAPGSWILSADHPEYAGAREIVQVSAGLKSQVELVLPIGRSLAGRVTWPNGSHASGATVTISFTESQTTGLGSRSFRGSEQVTADADGAFEKRGFGANQVINLVKAEKRVDEMSLEAVPGAALGALFSATSSDVSLGDTLLLQLGATLSLTGLVVDETGAAIESQFSIRAWPAGEDYWSDLALHESFSDSPSQAAARYLGRIVRREATAQAGQSKKSALGPGVFVLDGVSAGRWVVQAESEDHLKGDPIQVDIPLLEELRIVLPRATQLTGIVVDPTGAPVEGAMVMLMEPNRAFFIPSGESAESDAEGRFELKLDEPDQTVLARHPDWAPSEAVPVHTLMEGAPTELTLTLRVGATIRGVVFQEDGSPWPGRMVAATSGPAGPMMVVGFMGGPEPVVTDSDGRFELTRLEPGKLNVAAGPPQEEIERRMEAATGDQEMVMLEVMGEMLSKRVEVADGESVEVILGAEPKDPVTIQGRITLAGEGVSAMVMVLAEEGPPLLGAKGALADEEGRFTLELDRPGTYLFLVQGPDNSSGGESFGLTIPEVSSHTIELALTTSRIEGLVLGPDGEGVGGISLALLPAEGANSALDILSGSTIESERDGSFVYPAVKPGSYVLRANVGAGLGRGGANSSFGGVLLEGLLVGQDQVIDDVVLRLPVGGAVEGIVRDTEGNPVGGVAVFVRTASGRVVSALSTEETKSDGSYRIEGLAPGLVTVFARDQGRVTREAAPVAVGGSVPAVRDLELASGSYLVLFAVRDDEPVRVRASVVDAEGRRWTGLWTEEQIMSWTNDGLSTQELRVGPLPAGRYTVKATSLDGLYDTKKTITVREGQKERRVRLRMR